MTVELTEVLSRLEELKAQVSSYERERERVAVRLEDAKNNYKSSLENLQSLGLSLETVESKISENIDKISRALASVEAKLGEGVDPLAVSDQ